MKKIFNILAVIATILSLSSCLKGTEALRGGGPGDTGKSVELKVKVTLPQTEAIIDMKDIVITVQSKSMKLTLNTAPDETGSAVFNVAPDKYDILASYYNRSTRVAANGYCAEFLLCTSGIVDSKGEFSKPEVTIPMSVSLPSPIVIREIYYHGCKNKEGTSYTKDTYFEIYNNNGLGGADYYLDSLCFAALFPHNSTGGNTAWLDADTLAIAQMYWMIPGNGKTYKLKPGESAVVACKAAVDHSQRATSALHLEKAHFGCYDENLSGHEIAAGVTVAQMTMCGMGTAWALSIHSPALVLFRPEMGVAQYRSEAAKWERYEPGKSAGTKYWYIAKEWIIDGVECYDTPEGALKRLPSTVDASYACMKSPHYSGLCISRKLEFTDGGVDVFMDTNNSLNDFATDQPLSPRLKD